MHVQIYTPSKMYIHTQKPHPPTAQKHSLPPHKNKILHTFHCFCSNAPNASANFPCNPKGLSLLMSLRYSPLKNTRSRGTVWLKHCRLLFIKHVLPKLPNPASPGACPGAACAVSCAPYDPPNVVVVRAAPMGAKLLRYGGAARRGEVDGARLYNPLRFVSASSSSESLACGVWWGVACGMWVWVSGALGARKTWDMMVFAVVVCMFCAC